jgi:hypothetical protein
MAAAQVAERVVPARGGGGGGGAGALTTTCDSHMTDENTGAYVQANISTRR